MGKVRTFALALALLCSLLVAPMAVSAEVYEWDAADTVGMPKGVAGADGIRCHGEATQDGHTYKYTNYVGADADEMSSDSARERAWQTSFCRHILETDMSRWFLYAHGITLDTSNIRMTIQRL